MSQCSKLGDGPSTERGEFDQKMEALESYAAMCDHDSGVILHGTLPLKYPVASGEALGSTAESCVRVMDDQIGPFYSVDNWRISVRAKQAQVLAAIDERSAYVLLFLL